MKARIIWFPERLSYIDFNSLQDKIEWNHEHLETVRKYIKEDGLLFPGVVFDGEIHCGHYRFKIAKELGFDGIEVYNASSFKEANELRQFTELCYKHYKEYKELKYL
jgi:ParB-like chromosome segregation protein Spo0J